MKKLVSIILCAMMLIALSACGETLPADPSSALNGTADPTAAPAVTPTPDPTAAPDPVAYPKKRELSAEEQALVDKYYALMKDGCPEFYAIPRELLDEWAYVDSEGDVTVCFTFCLGGFTTDYRCEFSTSPAFPEGKWTVSGEKFAPFADRVLTGSQLASIKEMLYDSTSAWIKEKRLENGVSSAEDIRIFWMVNDGKLIADTEVIAPVGPDTEGSYGCIDHAHVFGRAQVEFKNGGVELTDLGASGS